MRIGFSTTFLSHRTVILWSVMKLHFNYTVVQNTCLYLGMGRMQVVEPFFFKVGGEHVYR